MVCKKRGTYGFLGTSWVLITMHPCNSFGGITITTIATTTTATLTNRYSITTTATGGDAAFLLKCKQRDNCN